MQTPMLIEDLAAERRAELVRSTRQVSRVSSTDEARESFRHRAGRALIGIGRKLTADDL